MTQGPYELERSKDPDGLFFLPEIVTRQVYDREMTAMLLGRGAWRGACPDLMMTNRQTMLERVESHEDS